MGYRETNYNELMKYHQALYEQLLKYNIGEDDSIENIESIETREEETALVITKNEQQFRLNSIMRPLAEAQRWANQYNNMENIEIISMYGLGNGLFVRELLHKASKKTVLMVYEPSAVIFNYVIENYNIEDILRDSRVSIIIEPLDRILYKELLNKNIKYFNMNKHLVCMHPQYDKAFAQSHRSFINEIKACEERIMINKNTLSRFGVTAVENTIKNLPIMKEANSISGLSAVIPKNIPVIIVSAGPSLDKNIRLLREAKGKSIIICVDTAIKYMLRENIEPDLTIVIEPEKPYVHYEDERSHKIPLICDIEANPEIVLTHTGRKTLFCVRGFIKQLLDKLGKHERDIGSGGSVATAAFAICYQLGFETVILIGQDLAYTGESTHAGGVVSEGLNHEIGQIFVEDVEGGTVRTRGDWQTYLRWFENALTVIKETEKNIRVIDATEGGARIHGTELMTLKQAIDEFCIRDFDFSLEYAKVPPILDDSEYSIFEESVRDCTKQLDILKEQATKGIATCEQVISIDENQNMAASKKCLENINRLCESMPIYQLVNNYSVSRVAEAMEKLGHEGEAGYYKQTKLSYEAIIKTCEEFKSKKYFI